MLGLQPQSFDDPMGNGCDVSSRQVRNSRECARQRGTDKHGVPHSLEHLNITTGVTNRGHATRGNPQHFPEPLAPCDLVARPEVPNPAVRLKTSANEIIDLELPREPYNRELPCDRGNRHCYAVAPENGDPLRSSGG
jgi:hypothetical protein